MKKPDIREYLTKQSIAAYREHVIEECARVIEQWENDDTPRSYLDLIAAIRALKGDKPMSEFSFVSDKHHFSFALDKQNEVAWERVADLAKRLGVEPLPEDRRNAGIIIHIQKGDRHYSVVDLVNAFLDRMDGALKEKL